MGISAYDEGLVAATSGMSEGDNPYDEHSGPGSDWMKGFAAGSISGEPFDEGVDAYGRDIARDECPYEDDSDEQEEWQNGWDEAHNAATDEQVKDNL